MPGGVNPSVPSWEKGDPIKADQLNDLSGMVQRLSQAGRAGNADITFNGAGFFIQPNPEADDILYWNGALSTCPAYGVMLTNGVVSNGSFPLPNSKQPDSFGCQSNFLINSSLPVGSSAPGGAQKGPFFIAAYDPADGTPGLNDYWGPRSGTFLLKKNTGGFRVHGIYDATNNLVLVTSEPMLSFYGKNNGSQIAKGTSGTIRAYGGVATAESDSGIDFATVTARFGNIAAGAFVQVFRAQSSPGTGSQWFAEETDTCA